MSRRRRAREWVLRALYAGEVGAPEPEKQLDVLLTHDPPSDCDVEFARFLFSGAVGDADRFDGEISEQLENWDISRLALIDLLLLRMALAEMECFPDIPHKVTLNEIIELAKRYSDGRTAGFVNGVLDGILERRSRPATIDSNPGSDEPAP